MKFKKELVCSVAHAKLNIYFCSVFPPGCTLFQGPRTLGCYNFIWNDVGCKDEGYGHPQKRSKGEIEAWNKLDIRLAHVCICPVFELLFLIV